jgi:hypothetical protein
MTRVLAVLAVILLGAFFMPWFGPEAGQVAGPACGGSNAEISGFSLIRCVVTATLQAADLSDAFLRSLDSGWFLWLLAAIPIFGVLTVFSGLAGSRSAVPYAFLAGGVPLAEAVYAVAVVEDASRYFEYLDVGAWLTLGTGLLLVLLAFTPRV